MTELGFLVKLGANYFKTVGTPFTHNNLGKAMRKIYGANKVSDELINQSKQLSDLDRFNIVKRHADAFNKKSNPLADLRKLFNPGEK